jgi:hypothetical protein
MNEATQTAHHSISPITLTAHRKIARNSYIKLATKVSKAAHSMQIDGAEIATLLTARIACPLTAKQTKRLDTLYKKMDRSEEALAQYLAY